MVTGLQIQLDEGARPLGAPRFYIYYPNHINRQLTIEAKHHHTRGVRIGEINFCFFFFVLLVVVLLAFLLFSWLRIAPLAHLS